MDKYAQKYKRGAYAAAKVDKKEDEDKNVFDLLDPENKAYKKIDKDKLNDDLKK